MNSGHLAKFCWQSSKSTTICPFIPPEFCSSPLAVTLAFPPAGTGGDGQYRGGDGVVRELEFLRPLTASILSERRAVRPFGLLGGQPGAAGLNLWLKRDGRVVSLGGKATVQVNWAGQAGMAES